MTIQEWFDKRKEAQIERRAKDLKGLDVGEHEIEVLVKGTDLKAKYIPKTTRVKLRITKK